MKLEYVVCVPQQRPDKRANQSKSKKPYGFAIRKGKFFRVEKGFCAQVGMEPYDGAATAKDGRYSDFSLFGGAMNRERKLGDDFTSPIAWVFSDPQHTLFARAPSLVSVNQYPPHSTTLIEDSYPHQAFPSHSKRCSYF